MKDVLEICKKIEAKHGENVWIDNFSPPIGFYIIMNKDGSTDTLELTNANRKDLEGSALYSYIKERMSFEGMVLYNANKVVASKSIHSVTSNSLIFKFKSVSSKKLVADLKKNVYEYFKALTEKFSLNKNADDLHIEFSNYIDLLMDILPNDLKGDNRLIILKEEDLSEYEKDYTNYLRKRLFIDNETELLINNTSFGVSFIATSLNDKKIFTAVNPYATGKNKAKKSIFRYSFEECYLLLKAFKLGDEVLNNLLRTENEDINIKFTPTGSIEGYSTAKNPLCTTKTNCYKISIIESDFCSSVSKELDLDRTDILEYFNYLTDYQVANVLRVSNGDYKNFVKKVFEELGSILITNRDLLDYYFNNNGDVNLIPFIEKTSFVIFHKLIYTMDKTNFKTIQQKFDLSLTILNYLDKKGGYLEMANRMKEIYENLKTQRKNNYENIKNKKTEDVCTEITIISDEEFFFASGQVLKYLSLQSKSGDRTGALIQDVVDLRNSKSIKDKMISKYNSYLHCLPSSEQNFINIVVNSLLQYKIEDNIQVKNNKVNKYYYFSGLIGKNVFFETLNDNKEKESE